MKRSWGRLLFTGCIFAIVTWFIGKQLLHPPDLQLRMLLDPTTPKPTLLGEIKKSPLVLVAPVLLCAGFVLELIRSRAAAWLNCGMWGLTVAYGLFVLVQNVWIERFPHQEHIWAFAFFYLAPSAFVFSTFAIWYGVSMRQEHRAE